MLKSQTLIYQYLCVEDVWDTMLSLLPQQSDPTKQNNEWMDVCIYLFIYWDVPFSDWVWHLVTSQPLTYGQVKNTLVFMYPHLTFSAKKCTFLTPLLVVFVYYICKDFCVHVANPLRIQL